MYRRHRDDPHFDFAAAAIGYAKAIEVELNALLAPYLREVDRGRHQSLGWFATQLAEPAPGLRKWLGQAFPNQVGWFTGELQLRLGAVAGLRNPGARRTAVPLALASSLREETLGIGQEGLIVRLARLREVRRAT